MKRRRPTRCQLTRVGDNAMLGLVTPCYDASRTGRIGQWSAFRRLGVA